MKIRVGFGFDVHKLVTGRELGWVVFAWNTKWVCWDTRMLMC